MYGAPVRVNVNVPVPVRSLVLLFPFFVLACESRRPLDPTAPIVVAAPPPVAVNSAPQVTGDFVCIGPAGRRHVYPLRLVDPDGDRLSWQAEVVHQQGELDRLGEAGLTSPADIEVVYAPPAGRPEENVIVLTVTDERGASTVVRLTARSG